MGALEKDVAKFFGELEHSEKAAIAAALIASTRMDMSMFLPEDKRSILSKMADEFESRFSSGRDGHLAEAALAPLASRVIAALQEQGDGMLRHDATRILEKFHLPEAKVIVYAGLGRRKDALKYVKETIGSKEGHYRYRLEGVVEIYTIALGRKPTVAEFKGLSGEVLLRSEYSDVRDYVQSHQQRSIQITPSLPKEQVLRAIEGSLRSKSSSAQHNEETQQACNALLDAYVGTDFVHEGLDALRKGLPRVARNLARKAASQKTFIQEEITAIGTFSAELWKNEEYFTGVLLSQKARMSVDWDKIVLGMENGTLLTIPPQKRQGKTLPLYVLAEMGHEKAVWTAATIGLIPKSKRGEYYSRLVAKLDQVHEGALRNPTDLIRFLPLYYAVGCIHSIRKDVEGDQRVEQMLSSLLEPASSARRDQKDGSGVSDSSTKPERRKSLQEQLIDSPKFRKSAMNAFYANGLFGVREVMSQWLARGKFASYHKGYLHPGFVFSYVLEREEGINIASYFSFLSLGKNYNPKFTVPTGREKQRFDNIALQFAEYEIITGEEAHSMGASLPYLYVQGKLPHSRVPTVGSIFRSLVRERSQSGPYTEVALNGKHQLKEHGMQGDVPLKLYRLAAMEQLGFFAQDWHREQERRAGNGVLYKPQTAGENDHMNHYIGLAYEFLQSAKEPALRLFIKRNFLDHLRKR